MNEVKEKKAEVLKKPKARVKREAEAPPYRAILIAVSVGVLIGLRLRR
jgi:ElaB/YqjD/DUF883 family membrane-anchored ribosome-binding protein